MGFASLIQIIANIMIITMLSKTISPSVINQIKTTKIDTKLIQQEKAIYEAVNRFIIIENTNPININDLITKGYFKSDNNNGFGGSFEISINSNKGLLIISTDISNEEIRVSFINSYKNTFKPKQGIGNIVETTFVLQNSIMHGADQFMSGIPIQSNPPSASSNKYWYDTSGQQVILRISDGNSWKTVTTYSSVSSTSVGTISNGTASLTNDTSAVDGDVKYVYDSASDQLVKYGYYNGGWYNLNNSNGVISLVGNTCNDGNALTINDVIRSTGLCKGSSITQLGSDLGIVTGSIFYKNNMIFSLYKPDSGTELYLYDGTTISLITDLNSGNGDSVMSDFYLYNNKLYFSATNGTTGNELFSYDGTTVSLVSDINTGTYHSNPSDFITYNGIMYFFATNEITGRELYSYDGTTVSLIQDLNPNANDSKSRIIFPTYGTKNIIVYSNKLYFSATDGTVGDELFSYDGTTVSLISDIYTGINNSNIQSFEIYNNKLYFSATNGAVGNELFSYDGTTVSLVSDIYTGSSSSTPYFLTEYNNKLYFMATKSTLGKELYSYNGVSVILEADINTGNLSSTPFILTKYNDKLYFSATTSTLGRELYSYDGTNLKLIVDTYAGNNDSNTFIISVQNNKLYFSAYTTDTNNNLFEFDE